MKVATAADATALQAWLDQHTSAAVKTVLHDGTQFVILYSELYVPTAVLNDRANTPS